MRIETERCVITEYQADEIELYYALQSDAAVMEHFPREQLLDNIEQCREKFAQQLQYYREKENYGVWKATLKDGQHIGHAVLNQPVLSSNGERGGPIQLGYSLRPAYWRQGYASEFARAMLKKGFAELALPEIIAVTRPSNTASTRVMERIGMHFQGLSDTYFSENLVVYNMRQDQWQDS